MKAFEIIMALLPLIATVDYRSIADEGLSGPYCGLYCLHAAAASQGIATDFESLVAPEYLSSASGSSAVDLQRAASRLGLQADSYQRMSINDLRIARTPIILHTRTPGSGLGYDHWVLFIGYDNEGLRLYDPPRVEASITESELLSMWDGVGIVISTPKSSVETLFQQLLKVPLDWVAAVALCGFVLRAFRRFIGPASLLCIATLVTACAWHLLSPSGFFSGRVGLNNVASAHFTVKPQEIEYSQLQDLLGRSDVTFVDARMPSAYLAQHIPGALNIPASSDYLTLRACLADIPAASTIVVYCQNDHCGWSDVIANAFLSRSYPHVVVYRGGMNDWNTQQIAERPIFRGVTRERLQQDTPVEGAGSR